MTIDTMVRDYLLIISSVSHFFKLWLATGKKKLCIRKKLHLQTLSLCLHTSLMTDLQQDISKKVSSFYIYISMEGISPLSILLTFIAYNGG